MNIILNSLLIILLPLLILCQSQTTPIISSDQSLKTYLFQNYNYQGQPTDSQLVVSLNIIIKRIIIINERINLISLQVVMKYSWNDNRLIWNPHEHNDLTYITIMDNNCLVYTPILGSMQLESAIFFPDLGKE
jgi:hypothetical protein